jgi:antitoxin (DNA-binding transcriptional repressor) of toxin-antitoxin stability system
MLKKALDRVFQKGPVRAGIYVRRISAGTLKNSDPDRRKGLTGVFQNQLPAKKNRNEGIIVSMATIHISEADAARDFAGLLARVRAGAEIVIESDAAPVAVLRTPAPPRRSIEECIALLPEDSTATIDEDFARDVQEAVAAHREPLNPPAWD